MGKLVSAILWFFSLALVLWGIITGPPSAISTVRDVTQWQSAFADPAARWTEELRSLTEPLPFMSAVPDWAMNIAYLVTLVAVILIYHHQHIVIESKRILEAATAGSLSEFHSHQEEEDGLNAVKAAVPLAGLLGGPIVAQAGAAAGMLGPVGWGIGAFVGSLVLVHWMLNRDERRQEAARAHDQQQTLQRERERAQLAWLHLAKFQTNERRKLTYAAMIVCLVVASNFIYPVAASLL